MASIRQTTCSYCRQSVVTARLQNGRWRSFVEVPIDMVAERDRYAFSPKYDAVVDLIGARNPPNKVLIRHYCRQYYEAKERDSMQLSEITEPWSSQLIEPVPDDD